MAAPLGGESSRDGGLPIPPPIFFSILLKRKRAVDGPKEKAAFLPRSGTFVPPRGRGSSESVPVKPAGLLPARAGLLIYATPAPRVRRGGKPGWLTYGPCF